MPLHKSKPFKRPSPPLLAFDARQASRATWIERGQRANLIGLGYTLFEAVVGISAGIASGSVSLLGFGLDAASELMAGLAAQWRLASEVDEARRAEIEHLALRIIGGSMLLLAGYVAIESIEALLLGESPKRTFVGIALAVISLVVMPWLAREKRAVATALKSQALKAQAQQSTICAWLAGIVLGGFVVDVALGWWWADAVAALLMTPLIAREGIEALEGHAPCGCEPTIQEVHARRAPVILNTERA